VSSIEREWQAAELHRWYSLCAWGSAKTSEKILREHGRQQQYPWDWKRISHGHSMVSISPTSTCQIYL